MSDLRDVVAACPDSPNCVSSVDADARHGIAPLAMGERSTERVHDVLVAALQALPRTRIVLDEPTRLRAECRSRTFRFVDDVELVIDAATRTVHVRSAARSGWWDLGVNRRRVDRLRRALAAAP